MTHRGGASGTFGDDVAALTFDGAGAVAETGMTSLSLTPSGAITLTAGAASTLSTTTGLLTVDGAGGLDLNAASGQQVALQVNGADLFTAAGTALTVQAGVTLGTTGSGNINLPNNGSARFQIETTAVGATVTAPNLDTLTNGSNADALHTHSGVGASTVDIPLTAGENLNAGDLVCIDDSGGSPRVFKADANGSGERQNPIGAAIAAATTGNAVTVRVAGEIAIADARFDGGTPPTTAQVGQRVFMSTTAGNWTMTAPSTSGDVVQKVAIVSVGGTGAARLIIQIGEGVLI
jgi:hypothetical protein